MGKKDNQGTQINFYEEVAKANIERTIQEEVELEKSNPTIQALKDTTRWNLQRMSEAREAGNEELRREIRNEIVVDNLRLVTQVLKKYGYFSPDKFQNGCIGLLKAAETYDHEKEVPFWNYAAFCIETEVRLAFKRVNRAFEGKKKGFLDSLDAPSAYDNGDEANKYDSIEDLAAEQPFDQLIEEAQVDTLFYDIIIPCIEQYGTRARDIDIELWKSLEIQYFIELSMEHSQRQRITFKEMARQLDSTPQNLRIRHKKVMDLIKETCILHGYLVRKTETGRAIFSHVDPDESLPATRLKHQQGRKHRKERY